MNGIETLIREWDGEYVLSAYDAEAGAWIFLAMHDRTLGMAAGGCRIKVYEQPADGLRDAMRLARGMTLKWAACDFPFGGGKTVIACSEPVGVKAREKLLLRLGGLIDSLGGSYGTGCDMGTTPDDMVVIGRRTRWVFGRPAGHGGHGDPGPWTARGVHVGMLAACRHAFGQASVAGRTVLIQGAGGVGLPLAGRLRDAGATILVTDTSGDRLQKAVETGATAVPPESAFETQCDIFAPCAIGGILDADTIGRLGCRVVAGSANNQLAGDEDAERLHARGILYTPDFVINAGGAIAHGALEMLGWSEERTAERIDRIGDTIDQVLTEAASRDESPLHGARRLAQRVLEAARSRSSQPDTAQ
jgi:leucine dehydrogenase